MGKCYNSTVVNAPADKVWIAIRNFHDASWAPHVVETVDIVGEAKGDQIGAKRVLNGAFHETLRALDDVNMTFRYSIDDGPGPVAKDAIRNYVGTVKVMAITSNDTSFVEWVSVYDSPNSGAVGELCDPIYSALLKDLAGTLG